MVNKKEKTVRIDDDLEITEEVAENAVVGNGQLDKGMAVMTKPFAIDDLARRIRDMIEQ